MKTKTRSIQWDLVRFAVLVRIGVILWTIITDRLVTNYDTSTFSPHGASHQQSPNSSVLQCLHDSLQAFSHWDGIYFLRIAKMGFYEYEHFHAFFPLYPICIRWVSQLFISPVLSLLLFGGITATTVASDYSDITILVEDTSLMLSGFLISNLCFITSVLFMFWLTRQLFTERVAIHTARIYAVSPASIFMSSVYTESLFAVLTLMGMYWIVRLEKLEETGSGSATTIGLHLFGSAIAFCLAALTRGNGIVCCGFFMYYWLLYMVKQFRRLPPMSNNELALKSFVSFFARCSIPCCLVIGAYVLFQLHAYEQYCFPSSNLHSIKHSTKTDWITYLKKNHPWCFESPLRFYGYVQKTYWNVGFLKYYERKQLPNFVLASPIILMSCFGIYRYARYDLRRFFSFSLLRPNIESRTFVESDRALVFVYYWAFLTMSGVLFMHIQVLTRFLASCPPLYWLLAHLLFPVVDSDNNNPPTMKQRAIRGYILLFVLVGPALFGNFYPWT